MMIRFNALVSVLDAIRSEAAALAKYSKLYASDSHESEAIWSARSRSFIHLYLKVMFGIRRFEEREKFITDGSNDGGVDGYYIDFDTKTIYLIQAKFRTTEENFEHKPIMLEELLKMDVKLILRGEDRNSSGEKYNGKILGLQRALSEIPNIPAYEKKILILANVALQYSEETLTKVCDGYEVEIFNFQ